MNMNTGYAYTHKRLSSAHALLLEETTTREKFDHICSLIKGINPKIDEEIARIKEHLSTWDKAQDGDVIMLSAENLPENTEDEKKRKKFLLLLIVSWRKLRSEVVRVEAEMDAAQNATTTSDKVTHWGKMFNVFKGLGVITIVAVAIVGTMKATAVDITVKNDGCATMYPSTDVPVSIPGLTLPSEPIVSGGSAVVTVPGFTVQVDGTTPGMLSLKVFTYSLSFQLPNNLTDVSLDNVSLLKQKMDVRLSEQDSHTLVLECS